MRLPDALLVRDAWMGAGIRERKYNGYIYSAVSIWADAEGAQAAAAALRSLGGLARVTRETLPHRARPLAQIYAKRPARPQKTNIYSPRRDRWMWAVWEAAKPACAGEIKGAAP